jgi:hypothetical protein
MFTYSNVSAKEKELDPKQVVKDINDNKKIMDDTFVIGKKGVSIITTEIRVYGLKETIKANSNIFVPVFIFIVFFLLYLKNKEK